MLKVRVIAPIFGIKFEHKSVILGGFLVTNKKEEINKIKKLDNFIAHIGISELQYIEDNYFFIYEGIPIPSAQGLDSLERVAEEFLSCFSSIISNFWFIKDNSCYVNRCYIQMDNSLSIIADTKDIYVRKIDEGVGDRICQRQVTLILDEEIKQWETISPILISLEAINNDNNKKARELSEKSGRDAVINHLPYPRSRYKRSLWFLRMVRREHRLYVKIALYNGLLECLFTNRSSGIGKQIRNGVLAIMGNGTNNQVLKDNLIVSYEIRSRFIHGDIVVTPSEVLKQNLIFLDDLVRGIYAKIRNPDSKYDKYKIDQTT